jgi:transcriptional regulator with XRE-family HTH domain
VRILTHIDGGNRALRAARERKGWTREEVAERVTEWLKNVNGWICDARAVKRWENDGVRPHRHTRDALCAIFAASPAELGFAPAQPNGSAIEDSDEPGDESGLTPGQRLCAWRRARGWTREDMAEAVGCNPDNIRDWEMRGVPPLPCHQAAVCKVMGTTPADIGWRACNPPGFDGSSHAENPYEGTQQGNTNYRHGATAPAQHERTYPVKRREFIVGGSIVTATAAGLGAAFQEILEILEDIDPDEVSAADPTVPALAAHMARGALTDYETAPAAALAAVLEAERRWVNGLRDVPDRHRPAITAAACQLSGVSSTLAADLGHDHKALARGIEARVLADQVGDPDLRAWARAQQSLAARLAGFWLEAVELADDGLHIAPAAPHQARLWLLRARAAAKIGHVGDVRAAVARGLDAAPSNDDEHCEFCLYGAGHVVWEAARALAAAGEAEAAWGHAEQALQVFDRQGLTAPVGRVELATALASRDPARGGQLVLTAIDQLLYLEPDGAGYGGNGRYGVLALREFVVKARDLKAPEIREAKAAAMELISGTAA